MKAKQKISASIIFSIMLATGIFWFMPDQPVKRGMLILTAVPAGFDLSDDGLGVDGKYITQAQIIAIDLDLEKKEAFLLSEGFYSARSPEVSWNGREMVFSGQRNEQDTWQIFVKDLETMQVRQLTESSGNCTDPAWLPDGKIAFSMLNEVDKGGEVHVLYACESDGTHQEKLMFSPNSVTSASVFQDGRILVVSEQKYPETDKVRMLALRIDGTKSELFYESENKAIPVSRGWECMNGKLYFIEKLPEDMKEGHLVSVDQGYPLSSWEELSGGKRGSYHSLFPTSTGQLLVSYKPTGIPNYGIYLFDLESRGINREIYQNEDYHLIEPVIVQSRAVPMKLPSIVDMSKEKGTLLCHNVEESTIPVEGKTLEDFKTRKVQVLGINGLLGEVPVEADGSFYVEVEADVPVRFQTLNAAGEILRGPSDWVWVRPNEKRSCIGCHEDREMAPENKVPMALYNGLVSVPEGTKSEPVVLSEKYRKR